MSDARPRKSFDDRLCDALKASITETVVRKRAAGELTSIPGIDAYRLDFVSAWNRFVEGQETEYDLEDIVETLHIPFTFNAFHVSRDAVEHRVHAAGSDAKIAGICSELMQSGTCKAGVSGEIHSPVVASKICIGLDDWTPTFVMRNPDRTSGDRSVPLYVPLQPIQVKPAATIPVDLPSGHMIIADSIRIKEFLTTVDSSQFNIGHAQERIMRSLHVAREHGLIEVAAHGIQTLAIERKDGEVVGLRAGGVEFDPDTDEPVASDLEILGEVITDYWAVMMIDREALMNILRDAGVVDPEAAFAEWQNGQSGGPHAGIQLEPGRWHLTFVDERCKEGIHGLEDLTDAFQPGLQTTLALTREPLKIDPDLCLVEDLPELDAKGPGSPH